MHHEYAHNAVCCMSWKVTFSFGGGGLGPLFLNFLDPPLIIYTIKYWKPCNSIEMWADFSCPKKLLWNCSPIERWNEITITYCFGIFELEQFLHVIFHSVKLTNKLKPILWIKAGTFRTHESEILHGNCPSTVFVHLRNCLHNFWDCCLFISEKECHVRYNSNTLSHQWKGSSLKAMKEIVLTFPFQISEMFKI